jgi:excisionase family DNA binding protein
MRYLVTMTIDIEEVRGSRTARAVEKPVEKSIKKPESESHGANPLGGIQPMVYGVRDAGRILGISRSSIYALLKAGLLTPVRIGRRLLFTERELRAFVEKNRGL